MLRGRKMTPKETKKDKHLTAKYGITLEQYNQRLEDQGFKCAMCGKPQSECKRALHVDHNHKTGKIRGLLCFYCNRELCRRHTLKTAVLLFKYMLAYGNEENLSVTTLLEGKTDPSR